MKSFSFFATLAVAVLLSACATTYSLDKLTPDEQEYMAKVNATSPSFEMDKAKSEEAWSRGNLFISRFSGMRVQSSNDYVVSTYDPNASETGTIGYNLTKEVTGNKVRFTVKCLTKFMNMKYTEEVCRNNEKIMAHYMASGELKDKFVDSKFATAKKTTQN
jgi:hypothetical protein